MLIIPLNPDPASGLVATEVMAVTAVTAAKVRRQEAWQAAVGTFPAGLPMPILLRPCAVYVS